MSSFFGVNKTDGEELSASVCLLITGVTVFCFVTEAGTRLNLY